jgi:hypothetical protein
MLLPALAVTVALVVQDQTPLRATAHETAPRQATLAAGDWLEVRGERQGYLQVYDHRHERPGYVRQAAVRRYDTGEASAPKLGTIVEFLRDSPGQESLGIGYVALFLQAAPPSALGPEVFDALGTMADRLARRASATVAKPADASIAQQIESAESYGVHFTSFEDGGRTRVCYDGEAFRRAIALGAAGAMKVRAAMGLTDPGCVDPAAGQGDALALLAFRASVVEGVDLGAAADVPLYEQARFHLRKSIVESELAYFAARTGDFARAKTAGDVAKRELMLADRNVLADDDRLAYDEAALHAAAVRWASEPAAPSGASSSLEVSIAAGEPGQTCIRVKTHGAPDASRFEHCTYGVVWPSSLRVAPHDAAVSVSVEPIEGWSELLLIHPSDGGWTADTTAPAAIDPELGYVELAGFSPDGAHVLLVRESRASGPLGSPHTLAPWMQKGFEVRTTHDLRIEKQAPTLANMATFKRWESPDWHRGTLALR